MICDCLNTCGDDPWLKDGRVRPCKNFIKREQQDKLAVEKMAKVTKIAELYGAGADFDLVVLLHEKVQHLTAELAKADAHAELLSAGILKSLPTLELFTERFMAICKERDAAIQGKQP